MDIILTNDAGNQLKKLNDVYFDCELNGGDRDFELTIPLEKYDSSIDYGCRVFVSNTEIGGIIGKKNISTSDGSVSFSGFTWRGMLANRIIMPDEGEDYKIVTGELNSVISDLLGVSGVFEVSTTSTGVSVSNYQFDRFCTLLDGLTKMLDSVDYRLEINYLEGSPNGSGYCELSALPIHDWSSEIELSQDNKLNFNISDKRNGVNHLIVGGKGELEERNLFHLYVDENGDIGSTQYYFGDDEIAYFYENTSTETDELEEQATEKLQELMNRKEFDMDVETLNIDIAIGDIVGGRDQVTGTYISKPLENIVVTISGDSITKKYTLEGDD